MMEHVPTVDELRKMNKQELDALAKEIRYFILDKVAEKGGHLASNLGVVELTLALHRVFDFDRDRVIFDVGHQAYTHKILSGRADQFDTLRDFNGLSGFPKRNESEYDAFNTGHSSTSISAGLGMARGRDIQKEDYSVISVIGDGSMTGGMAFEALNDAAQLRSNFIIILNDNEMSISQNVGGVSSYLTKMRTGRGYNRVKLKTKKVLNHIPRIGDNLVERISNAKDSIKEIVVPSGMFFENMGLTYLGPADGHNVLQVEKMLRMAKELNRSVLIHVKTKKGYGYEPALKHPDKFHGTGPFYVPSGLPKKKSSEGYTDLFANFMRKAGEEKKNLVAISAAMTFSIGLEPFRKASPDRCFDVGIAEQHAVTLAAGLAVSGMHPVVAIYSSFLQRAYDQIVHDVCMQNLPVVFAMDRAGLVGRDGETHQGAFDISFLSNLPNMVVLAPKNGNEFTEMLWFCVNYDGPIGIRYSRASVYHGLEEFHAPIELGKAEMIYEESEIALLAYGDMMETGEQVRELLHAQGKKATLVNLRFAKPFDEEMLRKLSENHDLFVTLEDGQILGGLGEKISAFAERENLPVQVMNIGVPDCFVPQGDVPDLKRFCEMDAESVLKKIMEKIS